MLMGVWLVIGAVVALAMGSFLSVRGSGGSTVVNLIVGVVGGFIGGYGGLVVGAMAVGSGPNLLVSLLAAAVLAAAGVLFSSKVVK